MADHGYIPVGKFTNARDDILHFLCYSDWANQSDGDVEAPSGYFWRISNTDQEVSRRNSEFNSVFEDWLRDNSEVVDSDELRAELVGHFIVAEDSFGFIYAVEFQTEQAMMERYAQLEAIFSQWNSED